MNFFEIASKLFLMLRVLIKEGVCACSWWRREVEYQLKFLAIGRLVVSGDDNDSDGGVHHVLDYMVFSLFFMKHDEITIVKRDTHDIYTITTLGTHPFQPTRSQKLRTSERLKLKRP